MTAPSSNKKILFVDQAVNVAGGQTSLMGMITIALDEFDEVSVLAPAGGELQRLIRSRFEDRVRFVPLWIPQLTQGSKTLMDATKYAAFVCHFLRHLPELRRADVVHINGPRAFAPTFALSRLIPARPIYHVRIGHQGLERRLIQRIASARGTGAVVFNSDFLHREVMETQAGGRADTGAGTVVQNCLYPPFDDLGFVDRFCDRPRPAERLECAVFGTVAPHKGQHLVVEAAARQPEVNFHIFGRHTSADYSEQLRRAARQNVFFHEHTSDVLAAYRMHGIQIALVPSVWDEPFGLVAIEGMAASCITLVRPSGGLASIAAATGATVFDNADDLVLALEELRQDDAASLAHRAERQHHLVQEHFGPERFSAELQEVWARASGPQR